MHQYIEYYLDYLLRFCPELTQDDCELFREGLTVTQLNKGDFYSKAGEIQQYNGFVVSGLIRELYIDEWGNETNVEFICENEYACHYPAFMEKTPNPFSYQCLEPSIIVNLPIDHIHNAYLKIPNFERYGRLAMEKKSKKLQQRLISMLSQNAEQRYLTFIKQYPKLFSRISISHLCSYLGVERQTLTRIRKKIAKND